MQALYIVVLVAASTVVGAGVARSVLHLRSGRLAAVTRDTLHFAGLWSLFLLLDVASGVTIILAVRGMAGVFVSVYLLNDISLVIASALQASIVQAWVSASRG